jgi:hypothetical protein
MVSGAIANKPCNGGNAWTRLAWILGLRRLGFDVQLVEQIAPDACVDAAGEPASFEESLNLSYFRHVADQVGLADCFTLVTSNGEMSSGPSYPELLDRAAETDLLINIGGHLTLQPIRQRIRCAVYVDDDPGYTQFWHLSGHLGDRLAGHQFFFTVGGRIGQPDCPIPTTGIPWRSLRPPVVLEQWPVAFDASFNGFTTVASWRGAYGVVDFEGTTYGQKVHEFRKFAELPQRVPHRFEIALDIHPSETRDLELLQRNGWHLVNPKAAAHDPAAYRSYLGSAGAEFSAAQGVYVQTQSGWFSDRTACYLACGKPALVQDTGLSRSYPVGEGLVTFQTFDEAVEGARRITQNYPHQCRAARALAEQYFDSDIILGGLVEQVGILP